MSRRLSLLLIPLLGACQADTDPAWALDPLWIEPAAADLYGFQTWQVYSEKWRDRPDDRFYLCAVVVELVGTETEPCPGCTRSWTVEPTLLESDCAPAIEREELFLSLRGVGIGDLGRGEAAEHPGLTSAGFADYGDGWETHGQAWPAALDAGEPVDDGAWDGEQPFTLWPDAIWPLRGVSDGLVAVRGAAPASATSVSRGAAP